MNTSPNNRNIVTGILSLAVVVIVGGGIALVASGKLHTGALLQNISKPGASSTTPENSSSTSNTQATNPTPVANVTLVRGGAYEQLAKTAPRGTEFLGYINSGYDKLANADKSDDEGAYLDIGFYKNELGDTAGAIEAYKAGVTRFPKDEVMISNLAHLFQDAKDYLNADKEFQYLLNVNPHNIRAYTDLGDLYSLYIPSKKSLIPQLIVGNGLKYNAHEPNLELYIAEYYRAQGDKSQAAYYYQLVLKQDPNNAGVQTELRTLEMEK